MAVGVVVGSAFTAIVNALVDNILMPLVGAVIAWHQLSRSRFPYSVGQSSIHQHWCFFIRCDHIPDYSILRFSDRKGIQYHAEL